MRNRSVFKMVWSDIGSGILSVFIIAIVVASTPAVSATCDSLKDYAITPTAPQKPLPAFLVVAGAAAVPALPSIPDPVGDFAKEIESAAAKEMEQYAVMRILIGICSPDSSIRDYFTSTCGEVSGWNDNPPTDPIEKARHPLQYDLQVIPGCIVKNRIGTSIGYLAENAYTSMRTNDATQVLYAMMTSQHLADDCKTASDSKAPACQIFAASAAVSAVMEINADPNPANEYNWEAVYQYDVDKALGSNGPAIGCNGNKVCTDLEKLLGFVDTNEKALNKAQLKADWNTFIGAKKGVSTAKSALANSNTTANRANWADAVSTLSSALGQLITDANCAANGQCTAGVISKPALLADLNANVMKIYADVLEKNYTAAVSEAEPLVDCLRSSDASACGGIAGQPGKPNADLQIIKVLAEIADGKTPDLSNGIADITLQKSGKVWWLGAQFGAQVGHEQVVDSQTTSSGSEYGLTMPIGIGLSNPASCLITALDNKCFYGFNINLVDLGALVSTSSASGVQSGTHTGFSQVLAPGVSAYLSVAGPLVVGLSYTYRSPNLRAITSADGTASMPADSKNRVSVFVAIDVPFSVVPR